MSESNLLKKLLIKPGQRVLILNAPSGYVEALGPLPEGTIQANGPDGALDFVHLFVKDSAELARLTPVALAAIKRDGLRGDQPFAMRPFARFPSQPLHGTSPLRVI